MKKSIQCLTILIICNFIFNEINGQNFSKSLSIGYSSSLADRRTDFLGEDYQKRVRSDNAILEHDFFVNLKRNLWSDEKWLIQGGLGYLIYLNTFGLPISRDFFKTIWLPHLNEKYYKHSASFSLDLNYFVREKQKVRISLNQSVYSNFSFFKSATEINGSEFIYWALEPSEIELYCGIQMEAKRTVLELQLRQLNLAFRDDALANNGKSFDFYNPLKLRITIGRKF